MTHLKSFSLSFALTFFSITLLIPSLPAYADNHDEKEALISFGGGVWDVGDDDDAGDFRLEYRCGKKIFWEFQPWVGGELTTDSSFWGGGGVLIDWKLGDHVYVNPSLGVGLYAQGSSDLDLGSPIEFRSQIEAGYEFDTGRRLGVSFGHVSNAGIDDDNPGTEVLNVYYHVPVGNIFSKSSD